MSFNVAPNFKSVDEILKCDHSNESYREVLSCGAESSVQGFVLIVNTPLVENQHF